MNKPENELKLTGPILALDLGEKMVGAAVSDEKLITIKRLTPLKRSNWKNLLQDVLALVERFDAQMLVIGLPLALDGSYGEAADNVQRLAQNFALSTALPVYLQDERLTSFEATANLRAEGKKPDEIPTLVDAEAAAIILRDFLRTDQDRIHVQPIESQNTTSE